MDGCEARSKTARIPRKLHHNNNNSVWLQREPPDSPFDSPGDAPRLRPSPRSPDLAPVGQPAAESGVSSTQSPNPPRARMSMPCPTHSQHTAGPARAPRKHAPLHAGHDDLVRVRVVQLGEREPPQVAELSSIVRLDGSQRIDLVVMGQLL